MEKLNDSGKNCLKERKEFSLYQSLAYFEKANLFFRKYIKGFKNMTVLEKNIKNNCVEQLALSISYINAINENEIPINISSLKSYNFNISEIIFTGGTVFNLRMSRKDEEEKYKLILNNYENILKELSDKICKEKAIYIENILYISLRILGDCNYKKYIKLGEDFEFIVKNLKLDTNEYWYKEFKELDQELKEKYDLIRELENRERIKIKNKYKEIFEGIELQFLKRKNDFDFIKYILLSQPYEGYEKDLKIKDYSTISNELIEYLKDKYNPLDYNYLNEDEKCLLKYFIIEAINLYLDEIKKKFY